VQHLIIKQIKPTASNTPPTGMVIARIVSLLISSCLLMLLFYWLSSWMLFSFVLLSFSLIKGIKSSEVESGPLYFCGSITVVSLGSCLI
jgi:hypothetical protein